MFADYPLPAGRDECPSELKLDQLHLNELASRTVGGIRYHIGHCARCQRRAALREAGLTAFPALDKDRFLEQLTGSLLKKEPAPGKRPWKRWVLLGAGALALLSTVAALAIL